MINRERGSYPWGAIAMNIELIVQRGKYDARLSVHVSVSL